MCFVVTCWERADLLALVCGVFCEFVTFPLVSWVRCGTWLYRFLIFAPLLTSIQLQPMQDLDHVTSNVRLECLIIKSQVFSSYLQEKKKNKQSLYLYNSFNIAMTFCEVDGSQCCLSLSVFCVGCENTSRTFTLGPYYTPHVLPKNIKQNYIR